jgi:protein-S-isoprenylcysteine O-methyltransferase Ste14
MTALSWTTVIVGSTCFLSFGVGIRFYFTKPAKKTLPMYLITEVGTCIALFHLGLLAYHGVWRQHLDARALAGALALYAGSLSLFWWTIYTVRQDRLTFAYSKDVPRVLIEAGPYRYIRHPFYTAYTLGFVAAPVALLSVWLLPTAMFMFIVYRESALMEEQKFADSELEAQYREYTRRTGRFFPRLFP